MRVNIKVQIVHSQKPAVRLPGKIKYLLHEKYKAYQKYSVYVTEF